MYRRLYGSLMLCGALLVLGCEQPRGKVEKDDKKSPDGESPKTGTAEKNEGNHNGWWCDEHGIKEEVCSMCSSKVAKAFQDKGDWCKEHTRAKSQCFLCDPGLRKKFAAEYVAKYGKEPPEPIDQLPEKK